MKIKILLIAKKHVKNEACGSYSTYSDGTISLDTRWFLAEKKLVSKFTLETLKNS